jgi:hypothetical protein
MLFYRAFEAGVVLTSRTGNAGGIDVRLGPAAAMQVDPNKGSKSQSGVTKGF